MATNVDAHALRGSSLERSRQQAAGATASVNALVRIRMLLV
jgi:hypothetical protein